MTSKAAIKTTPHTSRAQSFLKAKRVPVQGKTVFRRPVTDGWKTLIQFRTNKNNKGRPAVAFRHRRPYCVFGCSKVPVEQGESPTTEELAVCRLSVVDAEVPECVPHRRGMVIALRQHFDRIGIGRGHVAVFRMALVACGGTRIYALEHLPNELGSPCVPQTGCDLCQLQNAVLPKDN